MKQEIDAILSPYKARGFDAGCEYIAPLWQVWIGSHGGARANGLSLARELAAFVDAMTAPKKPAPQPARVVPKPMAKAVPVDAPISIPEFLKEPEDPRLEEQAARIAELEARLAEKAAEANAPPADIADLIDVADTPSETNAKLLAKWNETNGLIQLAHDRGERPSMDLIRKRDRLESGIRWNRGRSAEQL